MDKITEKSDDFSMLIYTHHFMRDKWIKGNVIVKEFIRKNKLIIYGGTAIDVALRLKGDQLYSDQMLDFTDYDFASPKNYEHAYELVDLLYNNGFESVRAIGALHPTTMRVDIGAKTWIADITYMPEEMFAAVPTVEHEGILYVHPDFQRLDQHRALSFPFSDAPYESVLNRTAKDIKRFNLLDSYYPFVARPYKKQQTHEVVIRHKTDDVVSGLAAFLIYKEHLIRNLPITLITGLSDTFMNDFRLKSKGKTVEMTTSADFTARIDICTLNLDNKDGDHYAAYLDVIPARKETDKFRYYRIAGEMSVVDLEFSTKPHRCANLQYVMAESLARAYFMKEDDGFILYGLCFELLQLIDSLDINDSLRAAFYPSLTTYGTKISGVYKVNKSNLDFILRDEPPIAKPKSYNKVTRKGVQLEWPQNDIKKFPYYNCDGKRLND